MAFKKTFVLSDEAVNSYGFRIITSGIRLENAKRNLPCFYDHRTWEVPLGHWENLRVEGVKLLADLVIEGVSDEEKEYIRKIQNGDIKGASVGADPITWSEDPMLLLTGQTRPTLIDCELFEASITPLPGNQNAMALRREKSVVVLNSTTENFIPLLKTHTDMKAIALKLGLAETATENEILAAIGTIQLSVQQGNEFRTNILSGAEQNIKEDAKEIFVTLSKTNPLQALKFAEANKVVETTEVVETTVKKDVKLSSLIQKKKEGEEDEKNTYDYLQKKNPVELARIRSEEPEKYKQLAQDYQKGVRYSGK